MTPYEILLSESQERMLLVAAEGKEDVVRKICTKWDLDVAIVGRVTDTGRWRAHWQGKLVADLPVDPLTEGAPKYQRPMKPHPAPSSCTRSISRRSPSRTISATRCPAARPPDHRVEGVGTSRRPHGPARRRRSTGRRRGGGAHRHRRRALREEGVAISVGANGRYCFLDPHLGAQHAVAECARNIACVGGEPIAVTDCLNFGNPEKPEIMWQFVERVRGIGDALPRAGTPVVSGNVSLYNETEGQGILPTPTIGMVGLVPDVEKTCTSASSTRATSSRSSARSRARWAAPSTSPPSTATRPAARRRSTSRRRRPCRRRCAAPSVRGCSSAHDCLRRRPRGRARRVLHDARRAGRRDGDPDRRAAVRILFPTRKDFVLFGDASRIVVSMPKESAARFVALARARRAGHPPRRGGRRHARDPGRALGAGRRAREGLARRHPRRAAARRGARRRLARRARAAGADLVAPRVTPSGILRPAGRRPAPRHRRIRGDVTRRPGCTSAPPRDPAHA